MCRCTHWYNFSFQTGKKRIHQLNLRASFLCPSGTSLLFWPSWLFWGCWTVWFSCRSSCPWWALRLRSPRWTMEAACPHLPPNPRCPHRWPTTGTTQAITTRGRLISRLFRSRRTLSTIRRWPPHQGSGRRIISTVTGTRTSRRTPAFRLQHLTFCWKPARTPASPSLRYAEDRQPSCVFRCFQNSCVSLKVNDDFILL